MCTTLVYNNSRILFGRNMDIDCPFGEKFVFVPADDHQSLPPAAEINREHYQLCGVASVFDGIALFAEAINEHGLYMASLNFPHNAHYASLDTLSEQNLNLAPYEVIPHFVANYRSVADATTALEKLAIVERPFQQLPLAPLHYFMSDGEENIIIEPTAAGLNIYPDEVGVLTNNPEYTWHRQNLENYQHLSIANVKDSILRDTPAKPYGEGLGLVGLPGDFSPPARYIRTALLKHRMEQTGETVNPVADVLHILNNVAMLRGSVLTAENRYDITRYSIVYDHTEQKVYIQTYDNIQILELDMGQEFNGLTQMKVRELF